jgi:hypothetical protein
VEQQGLQGKSGRHPGQDQRQRQCHCPGCCSLRALSEADASHLPADLHRRLSETRCPSHVRLARCGVPTCWDTDPEGRCASASSSDLNLSSFRRPVVAPTSVDMLLCRYLWWSCVRAEVRTATSSRPYSGMGARASRVSSCHLQHSHPCMDSPPRGGASCDYGPARRLTGCQTHECLMDPSLAGRRGIHVLSLLETASFAATGSPLPSQSASIPALAVLIGSGTCSAFFVPQSLSTLAFALFPFPSRLRRNPCPNPLLFQRPSFQSHTHARRLLLHSIGLPTLIKLPWRALCPHKAWRHPFLLPDRISFPSSSTDIHTMNQRCRRRHQYEPPRSCPSLHHSNPATKGTVSKRPLSA